MRRRSLTARLALVLGDSGGIVHAVGRTFDRMAIAEEEIEARGGRKSAAWKAFKLLVPTGPLANLSDEVYRAHARELLDRHAAKADTRPGTKAEVLGTISRMTLATRLDRDVETLGLRLCDELLGSELAELPDEYPGSIAEKLEEFRRRLAVADRRL